MSTSGLVTAVTDDAFEREVLSSGKPTLVDFWAVWCGPCRMIAPLVDELADQYGEKINFRKVDVDNNPNTAMQYGVKGIPTLMLFKGGQIVDQLVGAVSKSAIENLLKRAV